MLSHPCRPFIRSPSLYGLIIMIVILGFSWSLTSRVRSSLKYCTNLLGLDVITQWFSDDELILDPLEDSIVAELKIFPYILY